MQTASNLKLTHALLFFADTEERETVICRSEASIERGQVVFGNPQEVTAGLLDDLLTLRDGHDLVLLPANVLAHSNSSVAWHVPAQPRPLFFSASRNTGCERVSGQTLPQPPLVMIATPGSLFVYALQEDRRPEADTPLMLAPYYNLFADSRVCFGTMKRPAHNTVGSLAAWEQSFYESHFTHNASPKPRWSSRHTHVELWEAARDTGAFDPAWLVSADKTLAEAIKAAGSR